MLTLLPRRVGVGKVQVRSCRATLTLTLIPGRSFDISFCVLRVELDFEAHCTQHSSFFPFFGELQFFKLIISPSPAFKRRHSSHSRTIKSANHGANEWVAQIWLPVSVACKFKLQRCTTRKKESKQEQLANVQLAAIGE